MNDETLMNSVDDLIRLTVALNSDGTRADAMRQLLNAHIKQARIAKLLDVPGKEVSSFAAKLRKAKTKGGKK